MTSQEESPTKIAILGAGSWGATLARLYASNGKDVVLWARNPEKAAQISLSRQVSEPLLIELPPEVAITADLDWALADRDVILFCCKAQAMKEVAERVKTSRALVVPAGAGRLGSSPARRAPVLLSAAKGLELGSFKRMSEILQDSMPDKEIACLSGPNLAAEVLAGLPTASVVASTNLATARYLQTALKTNTIRLYSNTDVVGVELCGALKNIIAIAAGAVDALKLGTNAKSALITRGLAEMTRFATASGALPQTMAGLAGLGDLMATCSSALSRNWRMGYHLCLGESLEEIQAELGAVAEGVDTTYAVCDLSRKMNVDLPIATQVEIALKGEVNPKQAILNLMNRPLVSE